jgi:hypothetical protein
MPCPAAARRRPSLECLEARLTPAIILSAGVLSLTGGPGDDAFVLELQPGSPANLQASDDGGATFQTFALSQVNRITVNGLGGQNTLTINNDNGLAAKDGFFVGGLRGDGLDIDFQGDRTPNTRDTLIITGDPSKVTPGQTNPSFDELYQGKTEATQIYFPHIRIDPNYLRITDSFTTPGGAAATKVMIINLPDVAAVEDFGPVTTAISSGVSGTLSKGQVLEVLDGPTLDGLATTQVRGAFRTDLGLAPDVPPGGGGSDDAFEGFPPIDFANKSSVTVAGNNGFDLFLVNNPHPAAGLTNLTLYTGSPFDAVVVKNTPPPGVTAAPVPASTYFIQELYGLRLSRAASPSEVAFWAGVLNASGQAAVVVGIEDSFEARLTEADAWYVHYLGRRAQNGEETGWAQLLTSGAPEEQVLIQFLSSPEFLQHAQTLGFSGTPDAQFVQAMYSLALNRTASASEVAFWQSVYASQGAAAVAAGFLYSTEFRTDMVYRYYDVLLGRVPTPCG